jgi:hypothetical protein
MRGSGDGKHTTVPEHMPSSHRRYQDWTLERIARCRATIRMRVRVASARDVPEGPDHCLT